MNISNNTGDVVYIMVYVFFIFLSLSSIHSKFDPPLFHLITFKESST